MTLCNERNVTAVKSAWLCWHDWVLHLLQSSYRNQVVWWASNPQTLLGSGDFSLFKKTLRSETHGYLLGNSTAAGECWCSRSSTSVALCRCGCTDGHSRSEEEAVCESCQLLGACQQQTQLLLSSVALLAAAKWGFMQTRWLRKTQLQLLQLLRSGRLRFLYYDSKSINSIL